MGHEIEQFADGTAAFAAARKPGWHRLGTVFEDQDGLTAEQVLSAARLGGWNVRKVASPTVVDPVTQEVVTSDREYMIVRTNPVSGHADYLGMAGKTWLPIQNESHVNFFNALIDGGAGFDTAMSLFGGRNVVITMKLPECVKVAGVDRIDLYIVVINHHGGGSFIVLVTPVRVVCANTLRAALANFETHITIRHTQAAEEQVAEARRALGLSYEFMEAFEREAERMVQEPLTIGQFEKVAGEIFPKTGESKAAETNFRKRNLELVTLFTQADTQANIRGTRWAGYQAIVEWADWYMPVKGADDPAAARATRSVLGHADDAKLQAFSLLRVPA